MYLWVVRPRPRGTFELRQVTVYNDLETPDVKGIKEAIGTIARKLKMSRRANLTLE